MYRTSLQNIQIFHKMEINIRLLKIYNIFQICKVYIITK